MKNNQDNNRKRKLNHACFMLLVFVITTASFCSVVYAQSKNIGDVELVYDKTQNPTHDEGATLYVLVDKNNNLVTDKKFKLCKGFNEYSATPDFFSDLACVSIEVNSKDKCGYINKKGEFVIEPKFDNASRFDKKGNVATILINSKYGIINKNGKYKLTNYDYIQDFYDGYAIASKGDKNAFICKKGKQTTPLKSSGLVWGMYMPKGGFALECKDYGKCAYVNLKTGNIITDYKYIASGNGGIRSWYFNEGMAKVSILNNDIKDEYGKPTETLNFIDKKGNEILKTYYRDWHQEGGETFEDGLVKVFDGKYYGFFDKKGRIAVPFEYEFAYPFENGITFAKKNKKWGVINKKNKVIVPFEYDDEYYYGAPQYLVKDGKEYIIGRKFYGIKLPNF